MIDFFLNDEICKKKNSLVLQNHYQIVKLFFFCIQYLNE